MTVLHARTVTLGRHAERNVLTLWRRHLAGDVSEQRFVRFSATVLAQANAQAVNLADLALTAALIRHLRDVVTPLGLQPEDVEVDLDRLSGVIGGVLDADIVSATTTEAVETSRAARLAVTARAEPQVTLQNAMTRAMTEREVPGWTRELSPGACPLCQSLAGDVLPPTAHMVRHAGCSCVQTPVFN